MNTIYILVGVFIIAFVYWWFFRMESLDATVSTNPFSDLRCIGDNLPIVRILDNKTFQCLSRDNTNCMMRSDFNLSDNVKCGDVNTTLVKEIRNKNSPVTRVYKDLDQNTNYSLLTCNPQGLNNPDHWCGKLWSNIKDRCNKPEGKYGALSSPCKQIPLFLASSEKNTTDVDIVNRDQILEAKVIAKAKVDAARSRSRR
jgi:hypothetical protein